MLNARFQILLNPAQLESLRWEARRSGRSVSELVRSAIDVFFSSSGSSEAIEAAGKICGMGLPVADWPEMEKEIEAARFTS